MRIALAQTDSVPGAFGPTVDHMLQLAGQAARRGADVVVFPATVLSGAYPTALAEHRAFGLQTLEAIEDFARRTPIAAVVPAYVVDGVAGYLELFLCEDGVACPLRRREACRAGSEHDVPAEAPATCTVAGASLLFMSGDASVAPQDMTCDAVIAVTPVPYCYDDSSSLGVVGLSGSVFAPLLEQCPCAMAFVQGVGGYDDVVLAGGSFAVDPDGVVAAACPLFEEDVAVFEVVPGERSGDAAQKSREVPQGSGYVGMPAAQVPEPTDEDRLGYLYRALVTAVRGYVRKSGFEDAIVGLSGGIDSSLVAVLAADALGPEHVLGVLMPGPYSSESSVTDALELAARLELTTRTVPIGALFDACGPLFAEALAPDPFEGLARENLQARLRGTVLMTLSNARGALVLNTGNKSESGMGYSTLYGDTVGAYAPLCDVYKGRVYELARWRNGRGPHAVIPPSVLVKPPSAELAENQTDEESFGASYEQVDRILALHVERGLDAQDIADAGFDPAVVNRVLRACAQAEYKRRQEPMGPVVSLSPFVDRGWPVVLAWRDRAVADPSDVDEIASLREALRRAFALDGEGVEDVVQIAAEDHLEVDDALDAMLARAARQEQVMGMVGDVAFGAFVSGRGPDMDDCLGMPLFSKN